MGPTHPNRLMSLSGTIDPAGTHGGPVLVTNSNPDALWSVNWSTMPEALEDAGVSWKVYSAPGASPACGGFVGMEVGDPILCYFKQYQDPASSLYQKAFLPTFPSDLATDVARGTLPAVSWIISEDGYDEHPPSPPGWGELFTSVVVRTLASSAVDAPAGGTEVTKFRHPPDGLFINSPQPGGVDIRISRSDTL